MMNIKVIFIWCAAVATNACAHNLPRNELILSVSERNGADLCMGFCPEYDAEIYSNGDIRFVIYEGSALKHKNARLSNQGLQFLINKIKPLKGIDQKNYLAICRELRKRYSSSEENLNEVTIIWGDSPNKKEFNFCRGIEDGRYFNILYNALSNSGFYRLGFDE